MGPTSCKLRSERGPVPLRDGPLTHSDEGSSILLLSRALLAMVGRPFVSFLLCENKNRKRWIHLSLCFVF